jgi:hypothetical protein
LDVLTHSLRKPFRIAQFLRALLFLQSPSMVPSAASSASRAHGRNNESAIVSPSHPLSRLLLSQSATSLDHSAGAPSRHLAGNEGQMKDVAAHASAVVAPVHAVTAMSRSAAHSGGSTVQQRIRSISATYPLRCMLAEDNISRITQGMAWCSHASFPVRRSCDARLCVVVCLMCWLSVNQKMMVRDHAEECS